MHWLPGVLGQLLSPLALGCLLYVLARGLVRRHAFNVPVAAATYLGAALASYCLVLAVTVQILEQYIPFDTAAERWGLFGIMLFDAVVLCASLPLFAWAVCRQRRIRPY